MNISARFKRPQNRITERTFHRVVQVGSISKPTTTNFGTILPMKLSAKTSKDLPMMEKKRYLFAKLDF
jgi:hypothetical protein